MTRFNFSEWRRGLGAEFTPKLLTVLRAGISRKRLAADVTAGVIVGIVALPLAIAFAIASGVSPEKGLITAVIAGGLISLLGGSRVQIGGPTGAFIVIVYAIVQEHGVEGLTLATFIAGFLILLLGLLRMGNLLKFIPYSLIVGFTSGIAVVIFSTQIKDFFGLTTGAVPADFIEKWEVYAHAISTVNPWSVLLAGGTVLVLLLTARYVPKVPGSLLAILLCTGAAQLFHLPVDTIGSRFGDIPNSIPFPHFYSVDFATFRELLQPAIAIALLGSIESLLSAVVADGMIGGKHRSNMELVAQGGANIASALFGGIPATGAIARTATNIKSGGRTPVAGIVHAVTLLLIMLVAAPLAKLIPLACLAGILVVVAYNMGEWGSFYSVLRSNRYDALVLVATFLLTVLFDLVVAIEVGIVLASFIFMKRMADLSRFDILEAETGEGKEGEMMFEEEVGEVPEGVVIYEINGPLFFGASQKFRETMSNIRERPRAIIIRLRHVPLIDATGMYRLKEVIRFYRKHGTVVIISDASASIRNGILKAEILEPDLICDTIGDGVGKARERIGANAEERP